MKNTQLENRELRDRSLHRDFAERSEVGLTPAGDGLGAANIALDAALAKKALEPILLDVRGLCSYANYILILSGRSDRQVDAISDSVHEAMKDSVSLFGAEGVGSGQWALMDYGDLVIHIFHHPVRERYDLEGLWIDAPRVAIDVPDEARITIENRYGSIEA